MEFLLCNIALPSIYIVYAVRLKTRISFKTQFNVLISVERLSVYALLWVLCTLCLICSILSLIFCSNFNSSPIWNDKWFDSIYPLEHLTETGSTPSCTGDVCRLFRFNHFSNCCFPVLLVLALPMVLTLNA